ncbi:MAG TPA: hypothetical protein PLD59_10465 [Tepidisphaeraceae bacterium]|nr:hypothetical protein [Tepidisphaeraceae bacterium]
MLRYIKRAFFATIPLPILGRVPVNLIFVTLVFAAGFNREWRPIWLFGAWIEMAFLWILANNTRFQKAVDAEALARLQTDPLAQRQHLTSQLLPPARKRMDQLSANCASALDIARRSGIEEYVLQSQRDGLDRLSWLYLKLLLARQMLDTRDADTTGSQLRRQLTQLENDLASPTVAESIRESKRETMRILNRRLELLQHRGQSLAEIDADLARIEAQASLAVDNASLGPQSEHSTSTISLTSAMLENDLFGASQATVDSLDQRYQERLEQQ